MAFKITLPNNEVIPCEEKNTLSLLTYLKPYGFYSECQQGFCQTCKIKLKSGQVQYCQKPLMSDLLKDNEILPCCCIPMSDIEILNK